MVILNAVKFMVKTRLHTGGTVKGGGMAIIYLTFPSHWLPSELYTMPPPIVLLLKYFPISKEVWKEIGQILSFTFLMISRFAIHWQIIFLKWKKLLIKGGFKKLQGGISGFQLKDHMWLEYMT